MGRCLFARNLSTDRGVHWGDSRRNRSSHHPVECTRRTRRVGSASTTHRVGLEEVEVFEDQDDDRDEREKQP